MRIGGAGLLLAATLVPAVAFAAFPGGAASSDVACARAVAADLVTIQARLDAGRLDAARAYVLDLLQCPDGATEPRLHLALAEIEERLGKLNAAALAIHQAGIVAGDDEDAARLVSDAWTRFASRWVAVKLVAMPVATSDPPLEHAGMVADEATQRCVAELEHAVVTVNPGQLPSVQWLVPGDYRASGVDLRLPPGATFTIKIAAPPATTEERPTP